MKILILGNGFLGSAIIQKLAIEGHELRVVSRRLSDDRQGTCFQGDLFDFESLTKAFSWNPEIFIHTAWITTPKIYRNDPSNFLYAEATIRLAKFVAESSVKHMIILGSCSEYKKQSQSVLAGVTELSSTNLYSEQKIFAFNAIKDLSRKSLTKFTWARVFFPYGPNQAKGRLIPEIIYALTQLKPIQLSDITSTYDWISTRDVASAISWIVENDLPSEIDIATSIGHTNLEILSKLENILKVKNILPKNVSHNDGEGEVLVASKSSPLLLSGWTPRDTLDQGLKWVTSF